MAEVEAGVQPVADDDLQRFRRPHHQVVVLRRSRTADVHQLQVHPRLDLPRRQVFEGVAAQSHAIADAILAAGLPGVLVLDPHLTVLVGQQRDLVLVQGRYDAAALDKNAVIDAAFQRFDRGCDGVVAHRFAVVGQFGV